MGKHVLRQFVSVSGRPAPTSSVNSEKVLTEEGDQSGKGGIDATLNVQ